MFRHLRGFLHLTGILGFVWVFLFWPVRLYVSAEGVYWLGVALGTAWLPAFVGVVLRCLGFFADPVRAGWFQAALRSITLLAVVGAVRYWRPELRLLECYLWMIIFYLCALAVEVRGLHQELYFQESAGKRL